MESQFDRQSCRSAGVRHSSLGTRSVDYAKLTWPVVLELSDDSPCSLLLSIDRCSPEIEIHQRTIVGIVSRVDVEQR